MVKASQAKLWLLEYLTLEQAACVMLELDSKDTDTVLFNSYIKQLCSAANSGELKDAKKVLKPKPPTLMATTRVGGGINAEEKARNVKREADYAKNPDNLEYNLRSEVPRLNFIAYLKTKGLAVPNLLSNNTSETLDLNTNAKLDAHLILKVEERFYSNGEIKQAGKDEVQKFLEGLLAELYIQPFDNDARYERIRKSSTPDHLNKHKDDSKKR